MLVLNTLAEDEDPREVQLTKVPFWIQVHNLPAGFMSQKVGKNIADYIGEYLDYDEKNDNLPWRKYMRIRVLVDVRLPLKRTKKIKKPGGESKVVQFKYERLGTFCYICGLMGHSDSRCPKLFELGDSDVKREWSPELRADMRRKQGGESRWLRHGGDPNWVAPNPIMTCNHNDNNQAEEKSNNNNNNNNTVKPNEGMGKNQLAEIFRTPHILFPKKPKENNKDKGCEEQMDEDELVELVVEGDRKRSRSQETKSYVPHGKHVPSEQAETHEKVENNNTNKNFLLASPGGARQGL
jgi:hypothetical protein